jgi:hypothetical protein
MMASFVGETLHDILEFDSSSSSSDGMFQGYMGNIN